MSKNDVIEIFSTDNTVLISRISALFNESGVAFVILGSEASLLGGGIMGIGQRVMVEEKYIAQAVRLIREAGLATEMDFVKGLV